MTNEKKLEIAVNLLSEKDIVTFAFACAEYELAEREYLTCPHCGSQIKHDFITIFTTNSWIKTYQYECNDCGQRFFEHFERTRITK